MNKNTSITNRLYTSFFAITLLSISITLLVDNIKYYALALGGFALVSICIIAYYTQRTTLPVIIYLSSSTSKVLQSLSTIIIVLLMAYVIPTKYFFISAILLGASIIISIFFQKTLTIGPKGLRYAFRWNHKWEDIKSYDLNKENGTLNILIKNGKKEQITGIKSKHYELITSNIDNYFK